MTEKDTFVEITASGGPLDGTLGHDLAGVLSDTVREVEALIALGSTVDRHAALPMEVLFNQVGRVSLPIYGAGIPGMPDPQALRRQWCVHMAGVLLAVMAIDRRLADAAPAAAEAGA